MADPKAARRALMIAGKKARNELLKNTPGYNPKRDTFLRFGDVPEGERSKNWITGGREKGVSVYALDPKGAAVRPGGDTGEASIRVSESLGKGETVMGEKKPPLPRKLVQGRKVGAGQDEEPLIRDITTLPLEWHQPQRGARPNYGPRFDLEHDPPPRLERYDAKFANGGAAKRALMIARDQRALLRRIANIYPGPGGGMDPSPGGGGYSGPGGGKYIGPSRYADGGKVPSEPGKAPIPKGRARRFHYTDAKNVPHILKEGIQLSKSTGRRVGDPVAVWSTPDNPYEYSVPNGKALVEFHDDPATYKGNPYASPHSVPPENIMAVHMPWHSHYRYALEEGLTPEDLRGVQGEEYRQAADALERTKRATGGRTGHNGGPALDEVPPFKLHSGAAKIIGAKGQKKATPQQYAAMPGIKPDELKHSKFDTLGSKALPREEVIKHLEDNAVPLQETVYTGDDEQSALRRYGEEKTALPGGENYREVLLHAPSKDHPAVDAARARHKQALAAFDASLLDQLGGNSQTSRADHDLREREAMQAGEELTQLKARHGTQNYKSGHWDKPNVLAHVRMSDRKGPNGEKILHLEEAQSDWGQQGRDQGFKQSPEELERLLAERAKLRNEVDPASRTPEQHARIRVLDDAITKADGPPPGPYVDNTQKWTDLALKRVLHEAAHGGYDKIVVTPGDEQNKRYDLSSQVKNITYFPDIGYLHATTHDNQGIDHDDVKPEDLSKHIGKEAADRILKQNPQRYEGRGRLGGEFYHELEGDDLKMGGAGMRGYYDNILPKRLQALAQQHDPQAKVNLHGAHLNTRGEWPFPIRIADEGENRWLMGRSPHVDSNEEQKLGGPFSSDAAADDAREQFYKGYTQPVHSLDVTPQMRDSIKGNGFNSFKRGGEVGDDPIKDWQWRPVEDVRNELQLDEIPSHVHKFGEFMDETARRAATQGLTPRDLIKAYAITRSSIGRGALPVATVRRPKNPEYGFDALPKGLQGALRPEGAMGHWLHTKMGQRYLDEAEAGRVDEEAVRDAIKSMGAFGLPNNAEGKALRWAPKNLPGQEGRVSELIARAHRGQSSPEEWRGEMRVPGVDTSKAGFFASMLGRGDQPTFDARQIILNTGLSTKKAAPYLNPKGAKEAAVNRLADRQTELGLKHDKSMSPFYQHLTHHAIWDKTGGEETTHDDLMQALRGAKDGGRQGYAHGGRGHNGGPPLDDAGPKKKKEKPLSLIAGHPVLRGDHPVAQGLLQGLPPEAELQELLRSAGIVRPYKQASQDDIAQALKIAQRYAMPLGVGSKNDPSAYYNVKQPVAARDVTTRATETEGHLLKPENPLSWQQFGNIGKGGHVINLSGDRTRFGTLHEINDKPLNWPVRVYAGPDYIREPNKGMVWASASPVIKNMNKLVRDLSKKGPVFGMYSPYGGAGGDFAHHMFDAVMAQVNPDQISDAAKDKFDDAVRGGHFIMGQTDKIKAKRSRVAERMAGWPGIRDPKAASEFARTNMTGDQRKAILEYLDKSSWIGEGFPHVGMTRVAVTDPKLLGVPENMIGGNVARLEPSDKMLESGHTTFDAGQGGEYVGTLPFAQRHYALPVSSNHFLRTPSAGKGVYVDPYSLNDKAREGYRTLYERNYVPEPVSQRMVEGAEEGIAKMPLYGFKKSGGRAGYTPGGIAQLQQKLGGAFSDLNRQVAAAPQQQAPAGGDYQAMLERATQPSLSPDYQAMVNKALAPSGKTYEEMFPANAKPYAPAAAATPAAAAADALPYYQTNYGYSPTEILGGDGSSSGAADGGGGTGGAGAAGADGSGGDGGASSSGGGSAYRYGGQTIFRRNGVKKSNIVERALAVTRRK